MVNFHRKQVKTSHRSLTIILARFAILPSGVICVRNLRNVIIIVSFRQQCMVFWNNHALLPKAYGFLDYVQRNVNARW
jgi:hypothetical protein